MTEDLQAQTQQEHEATNKWESSGTYNLQNLLTQLQSFSAHFCAWPAAQDEQACYAAGKLMQRAGLAISELSEPKKRKSLLGIKLPVKYACGNDKWTGRGRKPLWVKALEASGESLEAYRVNADIPA